jgi:hypothetical protein
MLLPTGLFVLIRVFYHELRRLSGHGGAVGEKEVPATERTATEPDDIAGKRHPLRDPEGHIPPGYRAVPCEVLRSAALHEGFPTGPSPACADDDKVGFSAAFTEKLLYFLIKFDSFL